MGEDEGGVDMTRTHKMFVAYADVSKDAELCLVPPRGPGPSSNPEFLAAVLRPLPNAGNPPLGPTHQRRVKRVEQKRMEMEVNKACTDLNVFARRSDVATLAVLQDNASHRLGPPPNRKPFEACKALRWSNKHMTGI